jgi:tRNA(Ile)-lysidine synthase
MKFNLQVLTTALHSMPTCSGLVVGFSGGLDSTVLLHVLHQLSQQADFHWTLRALHINHGMQLNADAWERHCELACKSLSIDLQVENVRADFGQSLPVADIENAARRVRYEAFENQLRAGEALLLAHHLDDQMETFLLRLMRGSGLKGLAGIPITRSLGKSFLYRPLLGFERQQLAAYARAEQLLWLEDESNEDEKFDRNFCRQALLPLLATRWPGYRDSWLKTSALAAEGHELLEELATIDLTTLRTERPSVIQIEPLQLLSNARRRNLLRHWLQKIAVPELGWNRLQQLNNEVLGIKAGSGARLVGDGFQLRRYKKRLYALKIPPELDPPSQLQWDTSKLEVIELPDNGTLISKTTAGNGLALPLPGPLQIRYRQGGESCQLPGRPNKSLKKLLQEQEIEPWLRDRIPLLYLGEELVCVPGVGVVEKFVAKGNDPSMQISWCGPDFGFC